MNKKVLATAGIAALAVSATVAKADEVTTNEQPFEVAPLLFLEQKDLVEKKF